MNKPALIALLVAVLAALGFAVWYQQTHFDRQLQDIQKKLKEEEERSRQNEPFVPQKTSGSIELRRMNLTGPAFS